MYEKILSSALKELRKNRELADELKLCYGAEDIRAENFGEYMLFFKEGSRKDFEKSYFDRRRYLNSCAALALLYPENTEYLTRLQDIIWAICDEYSWVLPAHAKSGTECDTDTIDLFAAETAFALSEISYLLHDRLEPLILSRIKTEVKRRVTDVYMRTVSFWETDRGNWAGVCMSHVAGTLIYNDAALFEELKPRIDKTFEYFLGGFGADGACAEGIGYWQYGFGSFVCFADLAFEYSNGKYDYLKGDKIKSIAMFLQRCVIGENMTVSFADCDSEDSVNITLMNMLKRKFPEDIVIPKLKYDRSCGGCPRWNLFFRSLIYGDNVSVNEIRNEEFEYYFKDAEWFVKNCGAYGFAAKGGHNCEPHNHNDVGSFIYAKNGVQILCDIGSGEYTREYFGKDRYEYFCTSSLGHNVPVVNGKPQRYGREYCGKMSAENGEITIDMTGAYEDKVKIIRRFKLNDDGVLMTDSLKEAEITERLISRCRPEIGDGKITIGDAYILFDRKSWTVNVCGKEYTDHRCRIQTVYCIDFKPTAAADKFEIEIK